MTEKELLAAVLASPDDDAPRLVYADWLIERGDPRGEVIVGQIRAPEGSFTPTVAQAEAWTGCLDRMKIGTRFRRGFVEAIAPRDWTWVARAGEIFAEHPVDHLMLTTCAATVDGFAALAATPYLRRFRKLSIYRGTVGDALGTLLRAKDLAVEHLSIYMSCDDDMASAVARWPGLRRLTVEVDPLAVATAVRIAGGASLATVRSLALGAMFKGVRDVSAMVDTLVASRLPRDLDELSLDRNKLDRPTLKALFERVAPAKVSLAHTWMTDSGARTLEKLPGLANVRSLDLRENTLADGTKAALRKRFGDRVRF